MRSTIPLTTRMELIPLVPAFAIMPRYDQFL